MTSTSSKNPEEYPLIRSGDEASVDFTARTRPSREFIADVACVTRRGDFVYFQFGQVHPGSGQLRASLAIKMSPEGLAEFCAGFETFLSNLEKYLSKSNAAEIRLDHIGDVENAITLASNKAAGAHFGNECCVDFLNLSPFEARRIATTQDDRVAVESVVRILLPSALLHSVIVGAATANERKAPK